MREPVEAEQQEPIHPNVLFTLVGEIVSKLKEPNHRLIRKIVFVIGAERAMALLDQVIDIEAQGGQMTLDGSRRKTAGGLFISLARAQASPIERPQLRHWVPKNPPAQADLAQGQAARRELAERPKVRPEAAPAPVAIQTWEEAKGVVTQAIQSIGEARTVKITLVGRPGKVVQQASCVVVAMKGKEPASLPKGLPTVPANSAITWAVFIANKQWNNVKDSITKNAGDQLIVEGYPLIDPKSSASVVLVTSCKSVLQERAQREAKQSD